jgi:hypothetical protein
MMQFHPRLSAQTAQFRPQTPPHRKWRAAYEVFAKSKLQG